jgi:hypothetical protein
MALTGMIIIILICCLLAAIEGEGLFSQVLSNAIKLSSYEQSVEDVNVQYKFRNCPVRRLIVMPLSDSFRSNQVDAMHGKIQFGDKCSLPSSLAGFLYSNRIEVPWIFEIKPSLSLSSQSKADSIRIDPKSIVAPSKNVYVSPLDFRAPENYIFVPEWLMNFLNISTFDLVEISFLRLKLADLVILQPCTLNWDNLLEKHGDPKVLLERELNKYSSLTAGSTIRINIEGEDYGFYIKQTRAENGVSVKAVRIQDADVRTEIDRTLLDSMKRKEHVEE